MEVIELKIYTITVYSISLKSTVQLLKLKNDLSLLSAPRISLSLDQSEDDLGETPDDLDINVDDLDTPDEGDYLDYTDHEMDWDGGSFRVNTSFEP